jgi:hypothetical protein
MADLLCIDALGYARCVDHQRRSDAAVNWEGPRRWAGDDTCDWCGTRAA